MINVRGIFTQDKRFCSGNDLCNLEFESIKDFKTWVHNNISTIGDDYPRETNYNNCKAIEGYLLADSEYNKSHTHGNAHIAIYLITEKEYEESLGSKVEVCKEILYSNGKHTDGHEHLGNKFKEILDEINKKADRSEFNFV
jgi:hypothetical protein